MPAGGLKQRGQGALALLLALAVAACAGLPGGKAQAPRRTAAPNPVAVQGSPKADKPATSTLQDQDAQASGAEVPGLRLPGRLGLVLPSSLVGEAGRISLTGGDGKVGFQGSQIVALNDGRIVSNNSGALISDAGGNLLSDHGGGLIANNSGGIVSNNSGALIGNNAAGWRHLLQAEASPDAEATEEASPLDDPRLHLWLILTLIDLNDQVLQGYLEAKPVVGQWKRFSSGQVRMLPPPVLTELLGPVVQSLQSNFEALHFAGHLAEENGLAHLRVVVVPTPESPVGDGYVLLDMEASGADSAVAKTRFLPDLQVAFGLDGSAARVTTTRTAAGPQLEVEAADHYLPPAQRTGLGLLLTGDNPQVAGHRRVVMRPPTGDKSWGEMGATNLSDSKKLGLMQRDFYVALGYSAPGKDDPGLAFFNLRRTFQVGSPLPPFGWNDPFGSKDLPHSSPPFGCFLSPQGIYTTQPSAALRALLPAYTPGAEKLIPKALVQGVDPSQDPFIFPQPLPEALKRAPVSP